MHDSDTSFLLEKHPRPISISSEFTEITELSNSENGYSVIYKAKRMGKWHVLKCLKTAYSHNPLYQTLFHKEFELSYPLSHPNIVQTIGIENVEPLGICIVQEAVEGESLRKYMEHLEISVDLEYKIIKELCMALSYIHEKQIIHRDLKPDNILITSNGKNVKLIDFGLSDMDSYCILKQPAGNRKYASPEQKSGKMPIDYAADLYALGILIKELNYNLKDKRLRHISNRCTSPKKEKRFLSANEIISLLNQADTRRHKTSAVMAAILVLLGVSWGYDKLYISPAKPQTRVDTIFLTTHDTIFKETLYTDKRLEKLNRLAKAYVTQYYDSCHKYAWDTTLSIESRAAYWHMIDTGTSYIENRLKKEVALCTDNETEYALFLSAVWHTALDEVRKYNDRKTKQRGRAE